MTTTIRRPAVAGSFYPGDPAVLAGMVDDLLAAARAAETGTGAVHEAPPVAVIAPHAGYVYSGPVAARAFAPLSRWEGTIDRVVVAGPAHRVVLHDIAVPTVDAFATPLGTIPLDRATIADLVGGGHARLDDHAHAFEHSVEVHLPFLQRVLGDRWMLVPMVVGGAPVRAVADALEPLWGAPGTLVVLSTDLSHYHDDTTARALDRATASAICAREWERLSSEDACGAAPVRGGLELARRHDHRVTLVDLRTSADTAGSPDRVVGYGSFVVS